MIKTLLAAIIIGGFWGCIAAVVGMVRKKRETKAAQEQELKRIADEKRRAELNLVLCPNCHAELPATVASCPLCSTFIAATSTDEASA